MKIAGWKTLLGIRNEGSWTDTGTVTNLLPFLGENVTETPTMQNVPGVDALGGFNESKLTGSHYSGPVSFGIYPYNEALRSVLYCLLGTRVVNPTDEYIYLAGQPPGCTLCMDKAGTVHEYSGGKLMSVTLSGNADTPMVGEMDAIFARKADDTTENPSSSGWAYTTLPPIMGENLVVSINDNAGADFVAGDAICITNFSLRYTGDYIVHHTKCSGLEIDEPKRKAFTVALSLGVESFDAWGLGIANTPFKKIKIRGEETVGGNTKYIEILLPKCRLISEEASVPNENLANPALEFECLAPGTIPTGFPEYDSPLIIHWNQ